MNLQQKVDTYLDSQRFLLSAGNLSLLDLQELCPICRGKKGSEFDFCYEAYSAAGKTHLHQQVENQEEHAI